MAIKLDGTSGYLEHAAKIAASFPFTMLLWLSRDAATSPYWISQGQSSAENWLSFNSSNDSKLATHYAASGSSAAANKSTAPHMSSTMQLAVAVFTSASSRTVYFGDNVGVTESTPKADNMAAHDRAVIGARHYSGLAAAWFANATVAEAHWIGAALTATDVANLIADTVKPEALTGYIDGWMLKDFEPSGVYTSVGGTRTMTAVGGVTSSAATHPISRASIPAATISWTEGADIIAAAVDVTITGVAIAAAWTEGSDVISMAGTASGASIGTITSPPLKNNTGFIWANETGVVANIYNATTGALVVRKTGLTSSALGVVTIADVLIVAGTSYAYEIVLTANGRRLPVALAA